MLTSESAKEFTTARQKAFVEEWLSFFTGRPNDLLSFEEVKQNLRLQDSAYKGLQEVELDKIVGSIGRYKDFTRSFLPKNDKTEERWRQVDAVAHHQGYPPVDLYKVGDVYFVRDGNHRISVARTHNATTIEAYVIEYKTDIPISKDDNLDDIFAKMDQILLQQEHKDFFEVTHLDKLRPEQQINFTEPGRYRLLKEHIGFHKYLKETEYQREISYEEAVTSWYDTVYLPIVKRIYQSQILTEFPDRTEADLYAWLLLHRAEFEQDIRALGYVPTDDLIEQLRRERATNPFARLIGKARNQVQLDCLSLKIERVKFLQETRLDEIRPHHNIRYTEAGCYRLTKNHIDIHKYLVETQKNQEVSYDEAVASWYDKVYMPIVQLIRDRGVAAKFPKNTEADLYLWLVTKRAAIEEENQALGRVPDETLIGELEKESPSGPVATLVDYFSQKQSKVTTDLKKVAAAVL